MAEIQGTPRAPGKRRVAVVVSRFNEEVTRRLLEGARRCLAEHRVPDGAVDVIWVPGAFELPVAAEAAAASGRYGAIVALAHRLPVGFGVLTTDTEEQALARSGGPAGDKGYDAADAALRTADALHQLDRAAPRD